MTRGLAGRKDRLLKEKRHDVYYERDKWPEPTQCTECNALFINGRWTWQEPPVQPHTAICPACRRIAERYPAGYIEIKGSFFTEHRDEMMNLIRNTEMQEKKERPLQRIMTIEDNQDAVLLTTTGINLARRIGEALSRAYKGELTFQYGDGEESIRVYWQRQ
jgi:NMD protein affecting ribosome stability and mRNA decay